ncbi:hypothetical protein B0T14DRAFT_523339, partial [Immersiella caudata]
MAPPCNLFPVKDLPAEVQVGPNGKLRKTVNGKRIDLQKDCELLELLQYECLVVNPEIRNSPVQCWPVQRMFRRCQDKNGRFTVETTAWEGVTAPDATPSSQDNGKKAPIRETNTTSSL